MALSLGDRPFQKSKSAWCAGGITPGTRSASSARKLGRDFLRAYQSRVAGAIDQPTSPAKSSAVRSAVGDAARGHWPIPFIPRAAPFFPHLRRIGKAGAQSARYTWKMARPSCIPCCS